MTIKLFFSDYFDIESKILDGYGAFDICIDTDLPLFIDPFLLFSSEKPEYQKLHEQIVAHLIDLKNIAVAKNISIDTKLFQFPEIKQNWFGLCKYGNSGKGLGPKFAQNIIKSFNGFYSNFGDEVISESSHIEKLTLVGKGIGKDFISDFTTNLMLEFLLTYTEKFAKEYLELHQVKTFRIRCQFDAELMVWKPKEFILPYFYMEDGDFIILTPMDILTKDEAFICNKDLKQNFKLITNSLENSSLRNAVNLYFAKRLPPNPKQSDFEYAVTATINKFPEILDYYIKYKENTRDNASDISEEKLNNIKSELISSLKEFCEIVASTSNFFNTRPNSYNEALMRAMYLKDVIENNDGYRIFYKNGKPIASEDTIQRIFRLTWYASPYDINSEVNNGRGPADYKVSFGQGDSTIVEFKLASSSSLKKNLLNQTEIYKKASKSINDIKVILCYTGNEISKVNRVLKSIGQEGAENIVIINATRKTSASKT